jgi:membrane protein
MLARIKQLAAILDPIELQKRARAYRQEKRRWRAFGLTQLAISVHTARSLRNEEITQRAAALTYHTLLSLVPVLAVGFALFKAFGGLKALEGPLRQAIIENLSVGRSEEVSQWLDRFVANINAGAIAGVGVIFLFVTAVGLLSNIEGAFNKIWGIKRDRPLHMRFVIYWCTLTLAPTLVGLSLSLSARLQSSAFADTVAEWLPFGLGRVLISGGSFFSVIVALILMYQLVPNTKVHFRWAVLGGTVAGVLWTVSKAVFLWATAGSVKYSAIYGALGVLPLLMIWIYVSWLIVLFGVTYTFANQTLSTGKLEQANARISHADTELLALRLLTRATIPFQRGEAPMDASTLAEGTGAPMATVNAVLDALVEQDLLRESQVQNERRYLPARSPEKMQLPAILDALRRRHDAATELSDDAIHREIASLLEKAEQQSNSVLETVTLADLAADVHRVLEELAQKAAEDDIAEHAVDSAAVESAKAGLDEEPAEAQ